MLRLQEIRIVARRIANGDYAARAHSSERGDYEELDDLVRDMNTMAKALQARNEENALLQHQLRDTVYFEQDRATRDGLTGLRNSRYFHESLAAEIQRCQRTGEQITIAVLDLDNFKSVNDTYGHQEGDAVLVRVTQALETTLRPYDLPARMGGEEFGVIFPSTSTAEAKLVLDRMAAVLANAGPGGNHLGFSGGLATWPVDAKDGASLYELADASAYCAKQNGKNHTVIYDPRVVQVMNAPEPNRVPPPAGHNHFGWPAA
jgi:diguanylate cyclase (GGDEF)-like protein